MAVLTTTPTSLPTRGKTVHTLPSRLRVQLSDIDKYEQQLGLQIACPYPPCQAPVKQRCTRLDVAGHRHETRLLHIGRVNTAKHLLLAPATAKATRETLTRRRALLVRRAGASVPPTRGRSSTAQGRHTATWSVAGAARPGRGPFPPDSRQLRTRAADAQAWWAVIADAEPIRQTSTTSAAITE